MSEFTIYHNPRCSKSRAALALLAERGIEPKVVPYLEQTPSIAELSVLLQKLGFADARQLMRHGEAEYKELGLDNPALSQEALIATLAEHPRLIERPIVVRGNRAVIGRPPERVLEIL
jgi:arsenate reductase (glutaredoxin)